MADLLLLSLFFFAGGHSRAQEMVVGVNVVNPLRASIADENTLLGQLKTARVRVIRCGISNDDKGIDFARRAAALGIRLQLIVGLQYLPNAPKRPYQPNEFAAMWGDLRSRMPTPRCRKHFSRNSSTASMQTASR